MDECKPDINRLLQSIAHTQGLVMRSYLAEQKVSALKEELADLQSQSDRINRLVAVKTDELLRLTEEAHDISCSLRGEQQHEH